MLQFIGFGLMFAVIWDLSVDFSRSVLGHLCNTADIFAHGAYVINVKCMHNSASGHNVDCTGFTWGV